MSCESDKKNAETRYLSVLRFGKNIYPVLVLSMVLAGCDNSNAAKLDSSKCSGIQELSGACKPNSPTKSTEGSIADSTVNSCNAFQREILQSKDCANKNGSSGSMPKDIVNESDKSASLPGRKEVKPVFPWQTRQNNTSRTPVSPSKATNKSHSELRSSGEVKTAEGISCHMDRVVDGNGRSLKSIIETNPPFEGSIIGMGESFPLESPVYTIAEEYNSISDSTSPVIGQVVIPSVCTKN